MRYGFRSKITGLVGLLLCGLMPTYVLSASDNQLQLGLSEKDFVEGEVPQTWNLRKWSLSTFGGRAAWVKKDGVAAVKLYSDAALTFLEKDVEIDIKRYPIVSWKWRVENVLSGLDEKTKSGDDHPLRIFFAFAPDESQQSLWLRIKRFFYLDRKHGHPFGGRYTEYLWGSQLNKGEVIPDPGMPMQKLMVVEGGRENLGKWLSYRRNLYEDFKRLYTEEPRLLVYIGILNDTDQTGQTATSYIADLIFSSERTAVVE